MKKLVSQSRLWRTGYSVIPLMCCICCILFAASSFAQSVQPQVAAGGYHTVGLKSDGTVVAAGRNASGQRNVSDWTGIIQVAAGDAHTVGLKSDGTVLAVGYNYEGQCNVSDWTDIIQIAAGGRHTVGIKSDGTVVAVGAELYNRCQVSDWENIIQVDAASFHTVGLKSDGTVVATYGRYPQSPAISTWEDIIQVAAGSQNDYTYGLKSDGTVLASSFTSPDVSTWENITQVAAGQGSTWANVVGLKSDGTVVATGTNADGELNVSSWTDITQIAKGGRHTVGLKSDGTVVAVGSTSDYQCSVSNWTLKVDSLPEIAVFPTLHYFGDVQVGESSTAIFSVSNVGGGELTISAITLADDLGDGIFAVTAAPSLPVTLGAESSIDVEVTFTPDYFQGFTDVLEIESNCPVQSQVLIQLGGTGVAEDSPAEQVAAVIEFIEESLFNDELAGEGPGRSADNRVNALINMIKAAGDLLEAGEMEAGCQQLADIYLKVDGVSPPPDFVTGPAAEDLADLIQELMTYYGCE